MRWLDDLVTCLGFFSRLPLPARGVHRPLAEAAGMAPLAGVLIASVPAGVLLVALGPLALPASLAAPLALGTQIALTGALHEDGLADCADGFGGGRTRERKLEIMRDSRIGTFGACAIVLSLYLRAAALTLLAAVSPWWGALGLIVAAAASRAACLLPLVILEPARRDGLGAGAGRPRRAAIALALCVAALVACLPLAAGVRASVSLGAAAAAPLAALAVTWIARRQIGGQTGDVAGAAQQAAEIATLLALAHALPH